MEDKTIQTSKEAIEVLKKLRRLGRSDRTALIFLSAFCKDFNEKTLNWANRCLAIAEIMSRLAPKGQEDTWYLTGLIHRTADITGTGDENVNRKIAASLIRKAGFTHDVIYCIEKYGTVRDPRDWGPLMTSLIFADSHVAKDGMIMTTEECCAMNSERGKSNPVCQACMYARYFLSKEKCEPWYETAIRALQRDIKQKKTERTTDAKMIRKQIESDNLEQA